MTLKIKILHKVKFVKKNNIKLDIYRVIKNYILQLLSYVATTLKRVAAVYVPLKLVRQRTRNIFLNMVARNHFYGENRHWITGNKLSQLQYTRNKNNKL